MERCSHIWEELDVEKHELVKIQCPEKIWTGSKKYCIFHDPFPVKNTKLFEEKLGEKLEKKDYNFQGYYFPERVNFEKKEFEKDTTFRDAVFQNACFSKAIFQKNADFIVATFQKIADFSGATFQENVYFIYTTFQETADFSYVTFQNSYFYGATFQDADFNGAVIKEDIDFAPNRIEELDLRRAKFFFKGNITTDLSIAKFHQAYLENVAFVDCIWPKKIYEEVHMKDERLSFKQLETIYRNLKQNMQHHGDYSQAGNFYYQEMEMKRKGSNSKKMRIWLELYNIVAGYGEKPEKTAISAFVTILAFAFIYWVLGCLDYAAENIGHFEEFIYSLYFSFVTFTTLGIGDIKPLTHTGRILICCEAVIGAFLIALFVVVFARKMMR